MCIRDRLEGQRYRPVYHNPWGAISGHPVALDYAISVSYTHLDVYKRPLEYYDQEDLEGLMQALSALDTGKERRKP